MSGSAPPRGQAGCACCWGRHCNSEKAPCTWRSRPNGAAGNEIAHLDPLRVVDDHEGFADQHFLGVAQLDQRRDVLGVERERLLDQYMFSRFDGFRRPFDMLRCRQRDIDAVDFFGGEQFLIGAEGMACAKTLTQCLGLRQVAAGDRRQHAVLRLDDCRQQLLATDLCRRQHTPSEHRILSMSIYRRRGLPEIDGKNEPGCLDSAPFARQRHVEVDDVGIDRRADIHAVA